MHLLHYTALSVHTLLYSCINTKIVDLLKFVCHLTPFPFHTSVNAHKGFAPAAEMFPEHFKKFV